jgi:hypothetical protein
MPIGPNGSDDAGSRSSASPEIDENLDGVRETILAAIERRDVL